MRELPCMRSINSNKSCVVLRITRSGLVVADKPLCRDDSVLPLPAHVAPLLCCRL